MRKDSLLSKHAKTFYWAGLFLPKDALKKCSHLYDFCRTLDDIADQKKELSFKKKQFKIFKTKFKKKIALYPLLKIYGDSLKKKIFLKKLF
ncbi:phytoene synthase [Candidatus Pelagibacter sp. IMCC9063]|uniref:squalene/phytoene synthase family protein n=1 Tax=Pelagibacter sp. (strain IMCC9063) TaxID=1002672 RepID=UPI0002046478|nr:squalene/phytoene synthase family protein [Candidatus Pelagibacter sp. IMCC9063]AEA81166.1 phytoene synthase [Candidatus Pelagibacter sp. IMCC9063]